MTLTLQLCKYLLDPTRCSCTKSYCRTKTVCTQLGMSESPASHCKYATLCTCRSPQSAQSQYTVQLLWWVVAAAAAKTGCWVAEEVTRCLCRSLVDSTRCLCTK